ncbi:MAG: outer membrane protein assembly factor BamD [Candidatus Kapaibacterium sp.]|nr:MAG: outer membrane protein assembly factor BamD [Candidatus Kapabacteria bacterium]
MMTFLLFQCSKNLYSTKRVNTRFALILLLCIGAVWASSCSQKNFVIPRNVDEYYEQALEAFNTEDLSRAQKYFDVIKLQYPASKYADDAQYYLAEINVKKNENILAAYNYNQLRRTFPNSEFAKISTYKAAMSNFRQSPRYDRDQDYTRQAIKAFSEFQALYPKDSLSVEAGKRIMELRSKLAEHDFRTAELYLKLQAPRAAIAYFDLVLGNYPDTDYVEPSLLGKIKMQVRLKRSIEAQESMRIYRQRFPQGKLKDDADIVENAVKQLASGVEVRTFSAP